MRRVVAIAIVALLAAACGSSSKPVSNPIEQPPLDMRNQRRVEINAADNLFDPVTIEITAGTTVTWHNTDTVAHDVSKSVDGQDFGAPFGVRVPQFGPGATYSFTFDKPGVYFYTCTIHTGMNGKIQVDARSASTSTGSVTSSTAVG
jgi:plastocyanin